MQTYQLLIHRKEHHEPMTLKMHDDGDVIIVNANVISVGYHTFPAITFNVTDIPLIIKTLQDALQARREDEEDGTATGTRLANPARSVSLD